MNMSKEGTMLTRAQVEQVIDDLPSNHQLESLRDTLTTRLAQVEAVERDDLEAR